MEADGIGALPDNCPKVLALLTPPHDAELFGLLVDRYSRTRLVPVFIDKDSHAASAASSAPAAASGMTMYFATVEPASLMT